MPETANISPLGKPVPQFVQQRVQKRKCPRKIFQRAHLCGRRLPTVHCIGKHAYITNNWKDEATYCVITFCVLMGQGGRYFDPFCCTITPGENCLQWKRRRCCLFLVLGSFECLYQWFSTCVYGGRCLFVGVVRAFHKNIHDYFYILYFRYRTTFLS